MTQIEVLIILNIVSLISNSIVGAVQSKNIYEVVKQNDK